MNLNRTLQSAAIIVLTAISSAHAEAKLDSQQGTCSILAGRHADQFELKLNRGGDCTAENRNCQSSDMDEAAASLSGITTKTWRARALIWTRLSPPILERFTAPVLFMICN